MKFNYNSRTNITRQLKVGDVVIIKEKILQEPKYVVGLVYYQNSKKDISVVTARGADYIGLSPIDSKNLLQYICHIDLSLYAFQGLMYGGGHFSGAFHKHIKPIFMSEEVRLAYNAGLKKINTRTVKIIKNNLTT